MSIQIPSMWETSVLPGFDGIVWMQRVVDLPEDAAGKPLTLTLGPVDNEDETYFNGTKVGGAAAWDTPRHYEVPGNLVRAGTNVITVKVSDYDGEGGIGGKPEENCVVVDGRTYPLAGRVETLRGKRFLEDAAASGFNLWVELSVGAFQCDDFAA